MLKLFAQLNTKNFFDGAQHQANNPENKDSYKILKLACNLICKYGNDSLQFTIILLFLQIFILTLAIFVISQSEAVSTDLISRDIKSLT